MARVKHRVGIRGASSEIYRALFDPARLPGWWATTAVGAAEINGSIDLHFAELATLSFTIRELVLDQAVTLDCTDGPGPWFGSRLRFTLEDAEDQVFLSLVHENAEASDDDFLYFCTKWPLYLLSLRDLIENGAGNPYPNDIKILHGD